MDQESTNPPALKPTKSVAWMVAIIWVHIIIALLIATFVLVLLGQFLGGALLYSLLGLIIMAGALIFAIRLGIKSVLKVSAIAQEQIFQISLGVSLVYFGLVTFGLLTGSLLLPFLISTFFFPVEIKISLVDWMIPMALTLVSFGATYYWCKKLIAHGSNEFSVDRVLIVTGIISALFAVGGMIASDHVRQGWQGWRDKPIEERRAIIRNALLVKIEEARKNISESEAEKIAEVELSPGARGIFMTKVRLDFLLSGKYVTPEDLQACCAEELEEYLRMIKIMDARPHR